LIYVGTYPEDYEIRKFDLLRKWTAEGFVRVKHGLDLEEAADNCFNELINRSMIQPCFNDDDSGEVWACQVHDLMLDLIISKCKEENFITIIDRKFTMNRANEASADHLVLQNYRLKLHHYNLQITLSYKIKVPLSRGEAFMITSGTSNSHARLCTSRKQLVSC